MFAGVRPPRLAVLVASVDQDWQETCRRIIECLSTIWGGKHTILVPTDGDTIAPVFWKILEAFDPDYICEYHKTGRDWKIARLQEFEARVAQELHREFPDGSVPPGVRESIEEALEKAQLQQLGLSITLQKQLIKELAPFHIEDGLHGPVLYARRRPHYPLTALSIILPHSTHSGRLSVVDVSGVKVSPLWVEAILGATFDEYEKVLEERGVTVKRAVISEEELPDLFGVLMNGGMKPMRRDIAARLGSQTDQPASDYLGTSPFALTMAGLSEYWLGGAQMWRAPIKVVVGVTLEDFALYFSLSRMFPDVHWSLPEWVSTFTAASDRARGGGSPVEKWEQYAQKFACAISDGARQGNGRPVEFLSLSLATDDLERHMNELVAAAVVWVRPTLRQQVRIQKDVSAWLPYPRVVFNTDNFAVPTTQQMLEGRIAGFFPTPKPKGFSHIVPYEHRWITEVRAEGVLYPRHPALGNWLVRHPSLSTHDTRAGARGVYYSCPSSAYFGGDVDTILVRPQVYMPSAEDVFERLAQSAGWTTKVSDKGFFSADTVRKMGGLESAATVFRRPELFALLREYLSEKDTAARGIYLRSDRRRYLDLVAITAVLDGAAAAPKVVDTLVQQTVLHRGTILKCEYCRTADWFSVAEFGDTFTCKRCRRMQIILTKHTLHRAEPVWYYQLDELVYQGVRNDMHVPLLALDYLRRTSTAFSYTDELEIWELDGSKAFMEVDLCCICDGILTIGEAKSTERIESGGKRERQCLDK